MVKTRTLVKTRSFCQNSKFCSKLEIDDDLPLNHVNLLNIADLGHDLDHDHVDHDHDFVTANLIDPGDGRAHPKNIFFKSLKVLIFKTFESSIRTRCPQMSFPSNSRTASFASYLSSKSTNPEHKKS